MLAGFVRRRLCSDLPVTPRDVAGEFDVTEDLPELALGLLAMEDDT